LVAGQIRAFRTTDFTGQVNLLGDAQMCLPGDNASVAVSLDKPIALEHGSHFAIREGGKTVGSGVVVEVVQ
jgi:elongation factor Tu